MSLRIHRTLNYGEGGAINKVERWKRFWGTRSATVGNVGGLLSPYTTAMLGLTIDPVCQGAGMNVSPWNDLGPYGDSQNYYPTLGWVSCVAVDPNNQNKAFAGSNTGGLYVTTNFLSPSPNWVNTTDAFALPGIGMNDVSISPVNTNIVYAATGNGWGGGGFGYGFGIIVSVDGGFTWEIRSPIQASQGVTAWKVVAHPTDVNVALASVGDKLWRTTDQGNSWSHIFTPSPQATPDPNDADPVRQVIDIEFAPENPNVIYVSTNGKANDQGQYPDFGATAYRSIDGGNTWSDMRPPDPMNSAWCTIAVTASSPNSVWLLSGRHLDRSDAMGAAGSWVSVSTNSLAQTQDGKTGFAIAQDDANKVFHGRTYFYRSVNGGLSFTGMDGSPPVVLHPDCRDMRTYGGNLMVVGTDGGIASSTDGGVTWRNANGTGMNIRQFYGIGVNERSSAVGAGSQDNYMSVYSNGIWQQFFPQQDGGNFVGSKERPEKLYGQGWCCSLAAVNLKYLDRNSASGIWSVSNTDHSPQDNFPRVRSMVVDANDDLLVGHQDVWISEMTDGIPGADNPPVSGGPPNTWRKVSDFAGEFGSTGYWDINFLATAASDPSVVYTGFFAPAMWNQPASTTVPNPPSVDDPRSFFVTQNFNDPNGTLWLDRSSYLPEDVRNWSGIESLVVDPKASNRIWIGVGGFGIDATRPPPYNGKDRVFYSPNGGFGWIDMSEGLPPFQVNDMVYQRGSNDGLYLATDVGVFYRNASMDHWECFNEGMPASLVYDLDIDHCAGKLFAGTYGRGLWSTDLMDDAPGEWVVSNDFTLEVPTYLGGILRIASGATLTVTGVVNAYPGAKVIVEPGGRLIVDGGTLTSQCSSGFWSGVEVQGNNAQDQGGAVVDGTYRDFVHQGYVELRNGGTIEHARCAIAMKNGDVWGTFGGVVRSFGGVFRNNRRAVEFLQYDNTNAQGDPINNRSFFQNTLFTVDDDYRGVDDFHVHVSMWDVNGVTFSGCTFQNEQTQITESHKLGYGIHTLDAGFRVKAACTGPPPQTNPCPIVYQAPSKFIGLDHGIHALQAASTRSFHVENSEFQNNVCGVYSEGVVGFSVAESKFEVGGREVDLTDPSETNWFGNHRAVFASGSYGFLIDDNTIQRIGSEPSEGIVVGYSGGHNDMVFRNSAEGLDAAYVGEGICADENARAYIGLHFQCNTNDHNQTNIWSRFVSSDELTAAEQTIRTNQGRLERAADNTFDRDPLNWDVRNTNDQTNALTYWWQTPEAPNKPEYVTDGVIVTNDFNDLPVLRPAGNCATRNVPLVTYPDGEPGIWESGMQQARGHYVNSAYLYKQLIDGGSTDEMVEEVMTSWPEDVWLLRTSLLEKSPYLSVKVLKEMMNKPFLPDAIKAEVCIANPDATKSEGFMTWLEREAAYPLPQSLLDNIVASWDVKTFRTQLETTMAHHHSGMTQYANLLLHYHQTDEVEHVDETRAVWQQLRTPAARYAEALTYMQHERYTEAEAVITALPEEHDLRDKQESERWRMLALIDFLEGVHQDGRGIAQLTAGEQTALDNMIAGQRDRAATWAQNILCFHYDKCRAPLSGGDGGTPKARRAKPNEPVQGQTASPRVYPNPASTFVMLEVDLSAEPKNAVIQIQDITGRVLKQLIVASKQQQLVLDSREFAPGTYNVVLTNHDSTQLTKNLVIRQ
ncbi:MAG: T9SS type A sorting domain-containing protein [Flavobacteriales bacterium]|nr:MAG: T9SS type A sorting domain-containing protein [Flavobacteriales bacterium]